MNTDRHGFTFSFLFAAFAVALVMSAQERPVPKHFPPKDEAAGDASFVAFRNGLLKAAKQKNTKFLIGVLDANVSCGFGGERGIEDFRRMWEPEKQASEIWGVMEEVLSRGSVRTRQDPPSYCAPYYCTNWPDEIDAFENGIAVGRSVALRRGPSLTAPVLARLSYDIVRVLETISEGPRKRWTNKGWVRVRTLEGKEGYISIRDFGSPVGYRAGFEKKDGVWRIAGLFVGD